MAAKTGDTRVTDARVTDARVIDARDIDPTSLSDAALLAEGVERPDYYAEFYCRYSHDVLTFLVRRVGCAQTAADLASETFASALASRRSYREEAGTALQWLYGIARNLMGKYFRRERVSRKYRKRLAMRPSELSADEIERVEELADMPGLRARIVNAMQALPEGQARAVQLRIVEQRSYAEVARMLDANEGAVRVRVSRGLTRLAEILEDVR